MQTSDFPLCPLVHASNDDARASRRGLSRFPKSEERKMSERGHGQPLDQVYVASLLEPKSESTPRKLSPPPELADDGLQHFLGCPTQTGLCPDTIGENDLAARPNDTGELVERGFGVRNRGDDVEGDDDIERIVGKRQMLRIHRFEPHHVCER